MLIPMLKAINKMLEGCKPDKVQCASEVLSELIQHLEKEASANVINKAKERIKIAFDEALSPEAQEAQKEILG